MHHNLDARQGRAVRLGVAGATLAFLTLAGVQAVAIRPYLPPGELYHVGYAATALSGRLPTLTTPVPAGQVPLMPADGQPRRGLRGQPGRHRAVGTGRWHQVDMTPAALVDPDTWVRAQRWFNPAAFPLNRPEDAEIDPFDNSLYRADFVGEAELHLDGAGKVARILVRAP